MRRRSFLDMDRKQWCGRGNYACCLRLMPASHRRVLVPMISAAYHHVIFLARVLKITSCTFMAAPQRPSTMSPSFHRPCSCRPLKQTFHALFQPDTTGHITCYRQAGECHLTNILHFYKKLRAFTLKGER